MSKQVLPSLIYIEYLLVYFFNLFENLKKYVNTFANSDFVTLLIFAKVYKAGLLI